MNFLAQWNQLNESNGASKFNRKKRIVSKKKKEQDRKVKKGD